MRRFRLGALAIALAAIVAGGAWQLDTGAVGLAKEVALSDQTAPLTAMQAPPGAALPQVMECYDLAGGHSPGVPVRLITQNFGGDLVRVRTLAAMCENAVKTRQLQPGAPPEVIGTPGEHVFACYKTEDGVKINDPFLLTTRNFGRDRVQVVEAILLCESAIKLRTNAAGVTTSFGTLGHVLQCYSLRSGADPNATVQLTTHNFGDDKVIVRRAVMMCEEARKDRPAPVPVGTTPPDPDAAQIQSYGQATGLVWECFALREGDSPNVPVVLRTQNFGRDDVRVTRATRMCEIARKTPIYTHPFTGTVPPVADLDTVE